MVFIMRVRVNTDRGNQRQSQTKYPTNCSSSCRKGNNLRYIL